MPWLVGYEGSYRVEDGTGSLALGDLLDPGVLYCGYLLEGFLPDLERGRFRAERFPLAFRAGWTAVAVTARTAEPLLARSLGPFLAPTAPRPHARAPLGFCLFSAASLRSRLGGALAQLEPSLVWAARLNALIDARHPAFCDPVQELELSARQPEEARICEYRAPLWWREGGQTLGALLSAKWSAGPNGEQPRAAG